MPNPMLTCLFFPAYIAAFGSVQKQNGNILGRANFLVFQVAQIAINCNHIMKLLLFHRSVVHVAYLLIKGTLLFEIDGNKIEISYTF